MVGRGGVGGGGGVEQQGNVGRLFSNGKRWEGATFDDLETAWRHRFIPADVTLYSLVRFYSVSSFSIWRHTLILRNWDQISSTTSSSTFIRKQTKKVPRLVRTYYKHIHTHTLRKKDPLLNKLWTVEVY